MSPTQRVNALLTALDALRADVEELDRAYEREREHTRDLESRLADLTDDFHRVMDEDCESDLEKHCSCVPHLRRRIKELEDPSRRQVVMAVASPERDSIHRLQAQVGDLQRKLRVENGSSPDAPEGWVRSAKGWAKADLRVQRQGSFGPCVRIVLDEEGHEIERTVHQTAWDAMTRFDDSDPYCLEAP